MSNTAYIKCVFVSPSFKVRDVRMISDRNSRRSKGIAYVEFVDVTSVPLAIGLSGQRLLGVPIIVQASQVANSLKISQSNVKIRADITLCRYYFRCLFGWARFFIKSSFLLCVGGKEPSRSHG